MRWGVAAPAAGIRDGQRAPRQQHADSPPHPPPACENLEKLDLTVNFIADLTSVESLRANRELRELYLNGNPCCAYDGYRDYVVATLPQVGWMRGGLSEKGRRARR